MIKEQNHRERDYIDFKLYLTTAPNESAFCQVSLLPTPEVGESILPVVVPIEKRPTEMIQWDLEDKHITLQNLVVVGKQLADCLLPEGDIRKAFEWAYKVASEDKKRDRGVRLRLIIADHRLKAFPWEFVYLNLPPRQADSMAGFLALDGRVSIVRHEPLLNAHPTIGPVDEDIEDLQMVIATALPKGQAMLDLEREVANVQTAVKDFNVNGIKLTIEKTIQSTTRQDIEKLPKKTYIFHFAGHGVINVERDRFQKGNTRKSEGALVLEADKFSGAEDLMSANDVANALDNAGVRLAFLGACQTGARDENYPWDTIAGALAARRIPAILAMQHKVEDEAAVAFSEAFYMALAAGLSLDEAMFMGRRATLFDLFKNPDLRHKVPIEWGVPVLYSRLPDGKLFPERMKNPKEAAEKFRTVIEQSLDLVDKDGNVVGVRAGLVKSGVKVMHNFGTVKGEVIGAIVGTLGEEAQIKVEQKAKKVSGSMTGLVIDEL